MQTKIHPSSYAIAIHKIGEEEHKISIFHKQFSLLREIIDKNPQLIDFLKSNVIPLEERYKLVDDITTGFEPMIVVFIKVVIERNMAFILKNIVVDFLKMTNKELHIKYARVISAFPLTQSQITRIKTKLQKQTTQMLELTTEVDPSLISGFQIVFANELYEDNYQKDLEKIKYKIIKGKDFNNGK